MKKVLFIFVLGFMVLGFLTACEKEATSDGSITVTILDVDGVQLASKELDFFVGDTLVEVLEASDLDFELTDSTYGKYVSNIYNVTLSSNQYWTYYINDEYATVGISDQELVDGDVYEFQIIVFE